MLEIFNQTISFDKCRIQNSLQTVNFEKFLSPYRFQLLLNALLRIVDFSCFSQNSLFSEDSIGSTQFSRIYPWIEILYSVCSYPTPDALICIAMCPSPDDLLEIVSCKVEHTYTK